VPRLRPIRAGDRETSGDAGLEDGVRGRASPHAPAEKRAGLPGRAEAAIRVARRPARNTVSGTQAAARRGGEEVAVAWRVRLPTTEIVADTTTAHMATSSANVARPLRWEPQSGHAQRPRSEGHSDDPDGRAPAAPPPHRRRCRSDAKLGDGCVAIASADASDQNAKAAAGRRRELAARRLGSTAGEGHCNRLRQP